ncbi:MAG: LarC family nickel insertion protein [Pseudomonadota bacterium]
MSDLVIQIKPLGGIAGDMFVGACAALWPDLRDPCLGDLSAAGLPENVSLGFDTASVNGFEAVHFRVGTEGGAVVPTGDYQAITARLSASQLDRGVLTTCLEILRLLGQAEAEVHGKLLEQVHFHELADWDSVADIVAAASFITRSGVKRWSTTSIPLGGGTAKTQHGIITVPAPAVVKLLDGYTFHDDGIAGERVTPTGAAILRYLTAPQGQIEAGRLAGSGFGAGTKRFDGLANVTQLLAFDVAAAAESDRITEIAFEIDDMTPEELGVACDRMRAREGVLDVTQTPQIGKKGRATFQIRVLCQPGAAADTEWACFAETSTLGLRISESVRRVLRRHTGVSGGIRTKGAARPGGNTAKAESDDLAGIESLDRRRAAARAAEIALVQEAQDE